MNTDLKLDNLLRYGFCGTSFCGSSIFAAGMLRSFPAFLSDGDGVAIMTALVFAVGAAFYSTYRAIIYPYLGRLALAITIRKQFKFRFKHLLPTIIPKAEQSRDEFRWDQRGKENKPKLDEWASQIHLLYTISFSLWFGSVIGVTVLRGMPLGAWWRCETWNFDYRIGVPAIVLSVCAFISDLRRRSVEEPLYQAWKIQQKREGCNGKI